MFVFVLEFVIDRFFPSYAGRGSTSTAIITGLGLALFGLLEEYRLFKIIFDDERREIVFLVKHTLSVRQRRTLSYDDVRLELAGSASSPVLLFFSGKKLMFKVYKYKDGFSAARIDDIYTTARERSLPVKTVRK